MQYVWELVSNAVRERLCQIGTDPKTFVEVHPDYKIAPDQEANWEDDPGGAIADRELAQRYGWKIGDRLTLRGATVPINLELTIRGIYDAPVPTQSEILNWRTWSSPTALSRG